MKIQPNRLYVVETERTAYLGRVEVRHGALIIRSGRVGKPVVVQPEEVEALVPAESHPDVIYV